MLALVAGAEGYVRRHPVAFSDYASLSWQDAGAAARGEDVRHAEVLCLGDSLVKVGVLPNVLEARLGRTAFNLGIYGGQAASSYFLLRRALDSGARPRAILVDFHPNLLAVAPKSSGDFWPGLLDIRDALDLARTTADLGLIAGVAANGLVPSVRDRHGIRKAVFASLEGKDSESAFDLHALRLNWNRNRGAHLVAPRAYVVKLEPEQGSPGPRIVWSANRSNASYARRLFQLAADRRIQVVWVIPPADPSWQAHRERIGADAGLSRFVREISHQFPEVLVVDGRHSGYDRPAFVDETHMGRDGAAEFTTALADFLVSRLSRDGSQGGIVPLTPFQGRPAGIPLEDLQQTKARLAAMGGPLRF